MTWPSRATTHFERGIDIKFLACMVDPIAAFVPEPVAAVRWRPSRSNIAELNTQQRHERVAAGNVKAGRVHGAAPCRVETAPAAVSTH